MAGQSARDIRRRIGSVKNTQQITKAMEMVSAAKLRRAQALALSARPFAAKLEEVLARLVRAARTSEGGPRLSHPLLQAPSAQRVIYAVISADRGLAGGYNANVIRRAQEAIRAEQEAGRQVGVVAIGRKARDFFRKSGIPLEAEYVHLGDHVDFAEARGIARRLTQAFEEGTVAEVKLVYNEFINTVVHRPTVKALLPIGEESFGSKTPSAAPVEYLYEPSAQEVLGILLPRYVDTLVYGALLEAKASEHGARMTAMRNASDNAEEMIEDLTRSYNRARQAGITKELTEIMGGAEALAQSG